MANLDQLSLLHSEARERAASLAVRHTQVELDLTAPGDTFGSTTTIDFDCSVDQLRTFVDFKGDQLRSAALDGEVLDPGSWRQGRLPLVLTAGSHTLVLDGLMRYSSDGEGLHRHVDPADGRTYLYAMSFLDAGPRWFGCFDQPDLKSTYQWDVRAPEDWVVLGNGPSQVVEPGWWRIISRHPLATYHVTLVAGPYVSILDSHDEIPLGVHARASLAEALSAEAADIFEVTKASFDYYHRMFGVRYPFGEYHQVFVADFNAGAMENPGCVTLRDQLIFRGRATAAERSDRADVVAHELAHMWFGNLVTMRWWDDLWLNESFAEYSAQRCCTEATHYPQWTAFGIVRKDWGMVADQAPSTHPVAGNPSPDAQSALQAFDGISYAKGAAVLKQLVALLGERVFLDGLRSYFDRYVFGNAELADLLAAWSRSGAVDLDSWAQQWLRTSGLDTVEVELSPTGGRLRRIGSSAAPAERHHALRAAAYDSAGTKLSETAVVLGNRSVPIELPGASAFVVPDAADDTWAKVRFGDWPATLAALPGVADTSTRVVILNGVRDAVRDGDLDPLAALEAVCAAVLTEPSEVVLRSVLRSAQDEWVAVFTRAERRSDRTRDVNAAAERILASAEPGSDRQLAALRIAVHSSDDAAKLSRWWEGRLPSGVAADPELTWALVQRMSELSADVGVLDKALAQDPSASARVHAARARAALPTTATKEAAWELLMQPSAASAYEVYATAEGFFQPTQTALTTPFVPMFFAQIVDTAQFRTGWSLGRTAKLAYPLSHTSAETLELAERTLRDRAMPEAIRRALVDQTDQLRRAVVSQERFAAGTQ